MPAKTDTEEKKGSVEVDEDDDWGTGFQEAQPANNDKDSEGDADDWTGFGQDENDGKVEVKASVPETQDLKGLQTQEKTSTVGKSEKNEDADDDFGNFGNDDTQDNFQSITKEGEEPS